MSTWTLNPQGLTRLFINRLSRFSAAFSSRWCSTTNWKFQTDLLHVHVKLRSNSLKEFTPLEGAIADMRTWRFPNLSQQHHNRLHVKLLFRSFQLNNYSKLYVFSKCSWRNKKLTSFYEDDDEVMSTRRMEVFRATFACFFLKLQTNVLKLQSWL